MSLANVGPTEWNMDKARQINNHVRDNLAEGRDGNAEQALRRGAAERVTQVGRRQAGALGAWAQKRALSAWGLLALRMRSETSHNGRNLISEFLPCCSPRSVATNEAVVL